MVKKVLLGMMAFATLFATSCTNELEPIESGNTAKVSFKVETPSIESRAYSDGATATHLQYAVYDADGNILDDLTETNGTINGSTTVELQLTTGNKYSVIFWAAASNAPYSVDFAAKKMTVDYNGAVSNDENRDAFYKYHTFTVNGAQTETIELKRPFAQLNIGTADYAASTSAGFTPTQSAVTVKKIYNTLNFATGEVSGETDATFATAYIKKDETFPVAGYEYLAMNYLLVDAEKETVDVEFTYTDGTDAKTRTVGSVPVQRNYRTNIYGKLLTSEVDINIEIKPEYDGKFDNEHLYYVEEGTYYIISADGLKYFAEQVNAANPEWMNAKVALDSDIDLAESRSTTANWTPIGLSTDLADGKTFRGTFDGQGHTIKNMVCNGTEVAGLFGYLYAATIKNVTVEQATINSNHYAGGIVAWVLNNKGNIQVPMVIENCHVKNSTITSDPTVPDSKGDYNGDKVGGIVGYAHFGDATGSHSGANEGAKIANCSVENTTIKAYRDFGGLIGYAAYATIENCFVSNITLEQDLSNDYKDSTPTTFSTTIGNNAGNNTVNNNDYVVDGVTQKDENYYIYNAAGLKWVTEQVNTMEYYVNQAANIFDGKTVYLTADIDLNGEEWRPIGDYAFSRTSFNGVFDGQNHTISNFKVTNSVSVNWSEKVTDASYGLFGNVKGAIKNLTVKNATVNPEGGRYAAALVGRLHNGGIVENCHVIESSVTINHWQVGGLVGQNNNGNISNCSVSGSTITGKAAVGAIVGMDMAAGEHSIVNCCVSNTALVQNESFGASYDASYGLAVGLANASGIVLHLNDVVVENNTIKGEASNKLVGDAEAGATIYVNGSIPVSTAEELTAAKAGDKITLLEDVTLSSELTLPAGVTLNGNGKQINGTINAGGNLTFVGHTKVTAFSASYYDRVITIGEGACLEVTGGGRVSLAYGNTFNITGSIENAKNADKTNIQPSLIIPAGISITGGSDATFNVTNAYVQIGDTSSKNNSANGTFTLNITNSIAEFSKQLTFAEPTSGKNPTFNINVKNSVLTTGTKLVLAAPNSNMVVDNSTITLATYFRNSGKLELKNGSVLTGSTIQFGENGGNDGETIVNNSTLTINASSTGHALDGKGTGSITLKNGAEATVTYYKAMTIETDATSTFTGTEVQ